jgi:hypothetical protein
VIPVAHCWETPAGANGGTGQCGNCLPLLPALCLLRMASLFGAMKDRCAQSRQAQQNGCDGLSLPNEQSRVSYRRHADRRPQLAFPSNAFVPLVQMSDLIFGLAILTLRKKSNNLVFAARVLTTHVWPIIHNLSEAKIPR